MSATRDRFAARVRRLFWPISVDREIAEELAAHLELQTRRYMETGMSEADARRAARDRFGDVDRVRVECHEIRTDMETDMRRAELLDEMRQDVKFAVRALGRSPIFASVAIATLALGIGANAAIFSVVNAVLLRDLPYRNADRVAVIWNGQVQGVGHTADAAPEYFDLKEQLRTFDAVGAVTNQPSPLVGDGGEPERVSAYVVTPNVFSLLGASPAIGRDFGGDDGSPGAPRVAILSHALWSRRFGGDPAIIGKNINVGGVQRTVIGVMPPAVRFPDAPIDFLREQADLWIPSTFESSRGDSRGNQVLAVIARRAPGVTDARARADLDAVAARWRAAYPERYASASAKNWRLVANMMRDEMVGSARTGLLVITTAVAFVLLIACVNVANLLLARGASRERELAIRIALGAGRRRLVRQLLTEGLVLACAGGTLGVLLAWAGTLALVQLDAGRLPRLADTRIDPVVLAFSLALSILTGLLVALAPALQQSSKDLRGSLAEGTRGGGDGRASRRARTTLVMTQVAMAMVVLVGAGLLGRSFIALEHVAPGFAPQNVLSFQVNLPRARYDSGFKRVRFFDQLLARTAAVPGVLHASAGYPIPMSDDGWSGSFEVEGEPSGSSNEMPHAEYGVAAPGYFQTMRIPLVAGREFASTDDANGPDVVIVDEALAKQHWPNQGAINKRISTKGAGQWATVVGVVGHVHKSGPQSEGEPQIYLPYAQSPQSTLSVVLRTSANPATFSRTVRDAVKSIDPLLPVSRLEPVDALVSRALAKERFNVVVVGIFGLAALLLASVGLYGVMAYLVSQRTREIGIRLALGGQASAIRGLVLREALVISAAGLAIGTGLAVVAARAMRGLLFGIAPTDAATYVAIMALLLAVSVSAAYGPARRATRVDPLSALRQ